jgi:hypothetical protein
MLWLEATGGQNQPIMEILPCSHAGNAACGHRKSPGAAIWWDTIICQGSQGKVELSVGDFGRCQGINKRPSSMLFVPLAFLPRVKVSTPQGLPASAADHIAEIDRSLADAKSIPGSKQMTALRIPKNSPNHFFLFSNVVKTEEAFSSCQVLHKRPWSTRCWADNNLNMQSFCQQGACN